MKNYIRFAIAGLLLVGLAASAQYPSGYPSGGDSGSGTVTDLTDDASTATTGASVQIKGGTNITTSTVGDVITVNSSAGGGGAVNTVAGDSGGPTTGADVTITGSTQGIDTITSSDDTNISFDASEVNDETWGDDSEAEIEWTYDVSGTDHTMTAGSGLMTFSQDIQLGGASDPTIFFENSDTANTSASIVLGDAAGPDGILSFKVDIADSLTPFMDLNGTSSGGGSINAFKPIWLTNGATPGSIALYEGSGGGGNFVTIISPATIGTNRTCTLEDDTTPFDGCVTDNTATGGDGIAVTTYSVAVDLNTTADGVGATSNESGMEITATSELALLQGCSDNEILKYNTTGDLWECATDSGGLSNIVEDTTPQIGGTAGLDMQGQDITSGGVLFLTEQADAEADVAGQGQIWINTATPNELWWTDDAGTDVQLGQSGGLANVVEDTTPQLGGALDTNGQIITSASDADVTVDPDGTGELVVVGTTWDVDAAGDMTVNSLTVSASASPNLLLVDSDNSGELKISLTDATGPDGLMALEVDVAGTLTTYMEMDGINEVVSALEPLNLTHGTSAGEINWLEGSGGGANKIQIIAPATLASNRTCTLDDDGTPMDGCVSANFGTIGNAVADSGGDSIAVNDGTSIDFTTADDPETLTAEVVANIIDETYLAAIITLADDDLLDLSAINNSDGAEGLILPQVASDCAAAVAEGQICWDSNGQDLYVGNGTAAVQMNTAGGDMNAATYDNDTNTFISSVVDASETVLIAVRADSATACGGDGSCAAGELVAFVGAVTSGCAEVDLADADTAVMPAVGMVVTTVDDANCNGRVLVSGTWDFGADVITASTGDDLYVHTTAGAITATRPTGASATIQKIGYVIENDGSNHDIVSIFGANEANDLPNLEDSKIWVGNGSNVATAVDLSGDVSTVSNAGAVTLVAADLTTAGKIEIATGAETNTGTDATRAVSPDGLDDWTGSAQVTTLGTVATGTWQGTAINQTYLTGQSGTNTGDESAASTSVSGVLEIATEAEIETGTDDTRAISPAGFAVADYLTTGTIRGMVDVIETTATTDSPSADEMRGSFHTSDNASGTDYTLPSAVAGMSACFYDFNGGGVVTIDSFAGDVIHLDGTELTAGYAIDSAGAKGDFICLLAKDAGNWLTLGRSGTWIDGGAD